MTSFADDVPSVGRFNRALPGSGVSASGRGPRNLVNESCESDSRTAGDIPFAGGVAFITGTSARSASRLGLSEARGKNICVNENYWYRIVRLIFKKRRRAVSFRGETCDIFR